MNTKLLEWKEEGAFVTAKGLGNFTYSMHNPHIKGEGSRPYINGYWVSASTYLSLDDAKVRLQQHHEAVLLAVEKAALLKLPKITASSANAIAYQLEIGRENHSCPVDDKAIALWLRDLANQLDPSDVHKGNDGSSCPIKPLPPAPMESEVGK